MADVMDQQAGDELSDRESSEAREPRTPMTAEQALELIAAGKPLVNARITNLQLRGEHTKPIEMRNCWLTRLAVDSATFKARVAFFGCTLQRAKFGRDAVFEAGLSLQGSTLRAPLFERVTVQGGLFRLDNVEILGSAKFLSCRFEKVKAWEGRFAGWLNWLNCSFSGETDMRSINAAEGVVFENCTFDGPILMRGASVGKKLDFAKSKLNAMLDLSKAKLHDFVYLETIEAGPQWRFAVRNAVTNRLLVNPAQLVGRVQSDESGDHVGAMHEYGLLKRNYEAQHRHDDEDWAFYRFKINQRRCKTAANPGLWSKIKAGTEWLFLDQGCGYGANPWRAVRTAGIIIVLFAFVYALGITSFRVENPPLAGVPITDFLNRLLYGLATSVTVFTSGLSINALQITHGWMLLPLLMEALMGTLLWGLFIVAFSRKVIR